MEPEGRPEQDRARQLEKERQAQSASDAERGDGRRAGEAYTAMPDVGGKPKRKGSWFVVGAAVLALGLAAGAGLIKSPAPATQGAPPPAIVAGDVSQEKTFLVSMKDIDVEATQKAREIIKENKLPPPPQAAEPSRQALTAPAPNELRAPPRRDLSAPPGSTPQEAKVSQLQQELSAAPQVVRDAIALGAMTMFTFQFVDFVAEDGDIVAIAVDGNDLGQLMLSHAGASLTIPLKPGQQHTITVTAVYDGGGGVTFGTISSVGGLSTKVMAVGQSETWTIGFKK